MHDGAVADSARVLDQLAAQHPFVTPIWLSRNYGQHPATLAGMSSSSAGWVVTMDEDGQHDPRYLGALLDRALDERAQLVYAVPGNQPPHSLLRNAASSLAKAIFVSGRDAARLGRFSSYRLMWGEIARSVAAYCGSGIYLDVALSWVVGRATSLPVDVRGGAGRPSGYDLPKLASHFWRMVLTSGTRPLRAIAVLRRPMRVIQARQARGAQQASGLSFRSKVLPVPPPRTQLTEGIARVLAAQRARLRDGGLRR